MRKVLAAVLILLPPVCGYAQASIPLQTPPSLPSAPLPQAPPSQSAPATSAKMRPIGQETPATQVQLGAQTSLSLSLKEAEALALQNNPQISVARLAALASQQVTQEVRSNLWPTAGLNLTGVDSSGDSRITAGALNNPIVYQRAAAGVAVNQLLTDFGHTTNLAASADLAAKAENQNALATKEQILLAIEPGFLQCIAGSRRAQRRPADGECAAERRGSGVGIISSQVAVSVGLQFRQRKPGPGKASPAGRAK